VNYVVEGARFVTDFGDQAVLLPLAFFVAVGFALAGWRSGAIGWTTAVGGTFALMLVLKLGFIPCGHLLPILGLRSPSGHTAGAAVVYGGLFGIWIEIMTGAMIWTVPVALSCALIIGGSRLVLGVHSDVEVLIGGAVGVSGAVVAVLLAGAPPHNLRLRKIAVAAIIVLVLFHGMRLPAEAEIQRVSSTIWPLSACR
jgi:membrane-associated phospholipid phosphatase